MIAYTVVPGGTIFWSIGSDTDVELYWVAAGGKRNRTPMNVNTSYARIKKYTQHSATRESGTRLSKQKITSNIPASHVKSRDHLR